MTYRAHVKPVSPRHGHLNGVLRGAAPSRPHAVDGDPAGDATPAESAQARLFEDILRRELAELLNLPPQAQAEMRSRIVEVDRLIRALRHRFPRASNPVPPHAPGMRPTADRAPRALLN
jgi:hypothetical protein